MTFITDHFRFGVAGLHVVRSFSLLSSFYI